MKHKYFYLTGLMLYSASAMGQMHIEGNMQIAPGSAMSTISNVISNDDVLGDGILLFNGSTLQTADFNGNTLPRLALFNAQHLRLASNMRIGSQVNLSTGKIALNGFNIVLSQNAIATGATDAAYIVTNGNGAMWKEGIATNDIFIFPIGSDTSAGNYTPLVLTNLAGTRNMRVLVNNYATSAPVEGGATQGIDRTWTAVSSVPGNAIIELRHKANTEGSAFNRNAAFVTQWVSGSNWSVGTPNAGTSGGFAHSDTFNIPSSLGPGAFFSKSSNAATSLPVNTISGTQLAIKVAPNPFTETATLYIDSKANQDIDYTILDAQGRLVKSGAIKAQAGSSKHSLQLNDLASGAYMLQLNGNSINTSIKLIKQ